MSYDAIHESQGWSGASEIEMLCLVALKRAQLFIKRVGFKFMIKTMVH